MDPLTHAVTGSLLAQSTARTGEIRVAALAGALAGMAPDLDVLIRSSADSLLQIEYHRHFTHALAFAPVGAFVCALIGYPLLRRWVSFGRLCLYCFAGYVQGGLLDACTSYGTRLYWPFSDTRVAWSNVAVIDPLYFLPALGLLMAAVIRRRRSFAWIGIGWILLYLGLGVVQRERAEAAGLALAGSRGLAPIRIEAKPSIFNNFLFRVVTETGDALHADAIRVGWFSGPIIYEGGSVPNPSREALFAALPEGSTARRDIERFAFFSNQWVYFVEGDPSIIGDFRYALLPDSTETLWTLRLDRESPARHGRFVPERELEEDDLERFRRMLRGVRPQGD